MSRTLSIVKYIDFINYYVFFYGLSISIALQGKLNFLYYYYFLQSIYQFTNFFYLCITRDWLDLISAYLHNFLLTIVHTFLTNYRILRILRMYDVLRIHITNMVRAISLRSIELNFSCFDSFLILINIRSRFGER